jgi:hypothetical protein
MKHPHRSKLLAFATLAWAASLASPSLWAGCRGQGTCTGYERIVVLHFKDSTLSREDCPACAPDAALRPEEPVAFKIQGINPFRHTVTVKINQVSFDALLKPPSLISGQLMPSDTEAKSAMAQKGAERAQKIKAAKDKGVGAPAESSEDKLWGKLTSFSDAVDKLTLFDNFAAQLRLWALLRDDIHSLQDSSRGSADTLCQEIDRLSGGPPQQCETTPAGLMREYAKINFEVEQRYREMIEARAELKEQNLPAGRTKDVEDVYALEEQRYKSFTDSKNQRDQQLNRAVGLFAKIFEDGFGDLYFGPVAATGDQVEIVVDISLSPEAAGLKLTSSSDDKPSGDVKEKASTTPADPLLVIPVLGRHRPSFSTGIFFTGLVDKKAQDNQTDRFSTALGAMVHTPASFWWRHPDFSLHLSLGVALKDNNPIYVLGPSVIVGRQQRTVFTVGLAGGQVSRSSGSATTTNTQATPAKVFRTSFFFALSYNFGATTSSGSTDTSSKK